jgi:hypothetical protein
MERSAGSERRRGERRAGTQLRIVRMTVVVPSETRGGGGMTYRAGQTFIELRPGVIVRSR